MTYPTWCRACCGGAPEEKLGAEDLAQLGRALAVPAGQDTPTPHALQEALEAASVAYFRAHHARLDAQDGESVPTAAFHAARRLATHLPPVATRSGDTLAFAQFSTPPPLAVAARALLGPVGGPSVLEPTAGRRRAAARCWRMRESPPWRSIPTGRGAWKRLLAGTGR